MRFRCWRRAELVDAPISWHARIVLVKPRRVLQHLGQLRAAGVLTTLPTLWQLELLVFRMWNRLIFRSGNVGTSSVHPVRKTWRARVLQYRLLRFPFLLFERAIAPLDHTGLAVDTWRTVRHLLAAHHDRNQFCYDLEILAATPGALEAVRIQAARIVDEDTPRARWLKDLVVFEHYHEDLLLAVERVIGGEALLEGEDLANPDVGFRAAMSWALNQPQTPSDTWLAWRAGSYPNACNEQGVGR